MTTIRQLIQNGPAKANELFAKLGDTSDTAVKPRERLFAELKEELLPSGGRAIRRASVLRALPRSHSCLDADFRIASPRPGKLVFCSPHAS